MDERVCPECEAEYLPHVVECPHCEVPTRSRGELAGTTESGDDLGLAAGVEAVAVRTAPLPWARELAAYLSDQGVPCRIGQLDACGTGGGCSTSYAVLVRPDDLARAARLDQEHVSGQVPDAFTDLGALPGDRCPACGAALGEAEGECPDCGLVVA